MFSGSALQPLLPATPQMQVLHKRLLSAETVQEHFPADAAIKLARKARFYAKSKHAN